MVRYADMDRDCWRGIGSEHPVGVAGSLGFLPQQTLYPSVILNDLVPGGCYRSVISECGPILTECGPEYPDILNDCGPETPDVIGSFDLCSRAVTLNGSSVRGKTKRKQKKPMQLHRLFHRTGTGKDQFTRN